MLRGPRFLLPAFVGGEGTDVGTDVVGADAGVGASGSAGRFLMRYGPMFEPWSVMPTMRLSLWSARDRVASILRDPITFPFGAIYFLQHRDAS